jgi:hypothetical protein
MHLIKLIQFSKAYASLDKEVREAVNEIIQGQFEKMELETIHQIIGPLGGHSPALDAKINQALAYYRCRKA